MCGIVGVVSLNKKAIETACLKAMCDEIAHRGPDDAGYLVAQTGRQQQKGLSYFFNFTDNRFSHVSPMLPVIDSAHGNLALNDHKWDLFLGHRRLSILDISPAGHQPMSDLSRNIWIIYNGEVYNFKTLKTELIELGYEFITQTDTEVLIYAYREWGIEFVSKLNGMFAFALWDRLQQKFYLVRDRYGIKPLYYTQLGTGELVFASEVKAILKYSRYQKGLDHKALYEYFTFQNIFTDRTLYKDISLLSAGHLIAIDLAKDAPEISTKAYWDYDFSTPETIKDKREYLEELDRLFVQAVKRQLVSDVEVGSYLSGGMDSGSITAVAASQIPYLKTFTVGFDLNNVSGLELSFDEREKSEYLSYLYKTEHYEMVLKSGDMERCLPKFAWHLEEPRVGQSYPNYYAAQLASKFVKVVLSGAGGDELFGGYPWRYYRAVVNDDFEHYIDKYYLYWQRLLNNRHLQAVFKPIWHEVSDVWTRDIFKNVFSSQAAPQTPEDYVNHSLYFEAKTFLHGLLVVEDKLSMAHSLETRVPFLDNDLVDFAMKVPVNLKLGNLKEVVRINENEPGGKASKYFQKTQDGKLILRHALAHYLPDRFTNGIKQGFSSPDQSWFKGDSIEFVKNSLLNRNAAVYEFLDYASTEKLLQEHLSGQVNRRLLVWSLLNFEKWCRQYL